MTDRQMEMRFNGPDYDPAFDKERLKKQVGRIFNVMIDGKWRTLSEIAQETGDHEASISAQLRHLRKPRFGAYLVNRKRRGNRANGLFEYQVCRPFPSNGLEDILFADRTNNRTVLSSAASKL